MMCHRHLEKLSPWFPALSVDAGPLDLVEQVMQTSMRLLKKGDGSEASLYSKDERVYSYPQQ
jgi:hypothetical protein